MNSKLEYNRCLIPDITAEESQEETKREHKLDEELLKMRQKETKLWDHWKQLGGGSGAREARRLPKMTPGELMACTPGNMSKLDLDALFQEEDSPQRRLPDNIVGPADWDGRGGSQPGSLPSGMWGQHDIGWRKTRLYSP